MASFNKVLLMGNLTRDPELRYTASGAAVASLAWRSTESLSKEKNGKTRFVLSILRFGLSKVKIVLNT